MSKGDSSKFSAEQMAELTALAAMPDDEIDLTDAPEVLDWSGARRGLFYERPIEQKAVPVDADVVEWFRAQAKGQDSYQDKINQTLRQYISEQMRRAG